MNIIAFDTLKFSQRLQKGGFSIKQSTAAAEALADLALMQTEGLATKEDIQRLEFAGLEIRNELKEDIKRLELSGLGMRNELKEEIDQFKQEVREALHRLCLEVAKLRVEIISSRNHIIAWMIGTQVAWVGLALAFLKLT